MGRAFLDELQLPSFSQAERDPTPTPPCPQHHLIPCSPLPPLTPPPTPPPLNPLPEPPPRTSSPNPLPEPPPRSPSPTPLP